MTLKQQLHEVLLTRVEDKLNFYRETLLGLRQSAANETKSTAGDKHETALAMLQIEQENTNQRLEEALLNLSKIKKIDPNIITVSIVPGSLVETNRGYFYISVPGGKLVIGDITVTTLSINSPLGQLLKARNAGDQFFMNGIEYHILSIL